MSAPGKRMDSAQALGIDFDNPRGCWRVTAEHLEVFAVPVSPEGAALGTGLYLFTLRRGQVGFGIAPRALEDGRRLAIRPGRRRAAGACTVPWHELAAGTDGKGIEAAAEAWLTKLLSAVRSEQDAELIAKPNIAGQEARAGTRVGAPRGTLLWVSAEQGSLRWFDRQDAELTAGALPLPLTGDIWASAAEQTQFCAQTTRGLIEAGEHFEVAFEQANARIFALIADQFSAHAAAERKRLSNRLRQTAQLFAEGLGRAGSVLRERDDVLDLAGSGDAVYAAASAVAARRGIELVRVSRKSDDPIEYLEELCSAARIHLRPVRLAQGWHHRDNGPLIGFAQTEAGELHPLALLPAGASAYRAFDPAAGTSRVVNSAEAARILPDAYMLYPRLEQSVVSLRALLRFGIAGSRRDGTRLVVMGILAGVLGLVLPILSDPIFNDILPRADVNSLATVVMALAMTALGTAAFRLVRSLALLRIGGRMESAIQASVWDRLLHLAPRFFRDYSTGDLAERVMNLSAVRTVATSAISGSVLDAIFSVVSFALMFWFSWKLALLASGLGLIALIATLFLSASQVPHQRVLIQHGGRLSGFTYQLLTAIGKLRVAGAEARAFARWTGMLARQKDAAYRARRIAAVQQSLAQAFPPLASIAIYVATIQLGEPMGSSEGKIPLLDLGAFLAFNAAFGQFVSSLISAVTGTTSLVSVLPLFERVKPILSATPESFGISTAPGVLTGSLEFRQVSFRYRDNVAPVLDEVSFRIASGEYVAIVGPSGSGKSTIARLALGFESPQSGGVFFDHKDLSKLDVAAVRRQIGAVMQNAGILSGSLFENIAGSRAISMHEAWEAAKIAGIDRDIQSMPMGMFTHISDSAPMLSGGQKQRLIIARALVNKPCILLFDEATSALDNRTQSIVNEALAQLNLTRIVIAHRLSTVRRVNRILVLNKGRIVEDGSYEQLMERNGEFAQMARLQSF